MYNFVWLNDKAMKPYIRKVNYYECDRMGVTHHSNYVRYMEEARIAFLDDLGYGYERMEAEGVTSPVVSLEVKYLKPSTFADVISIQVSVADLTPLKLTFSYAMMLDGQVIFTGRSTHCFIENGRPVVIADRFPELAARLKASEE